MGFLRVDKQAVCESRRSRYRTIIPLIFVATCYGSSDPLAGAEMVRGGPSCLTKLDSKAGPVAVTGDKLELRLYERFETNDQQLINRQEQGRTGNEFALQTEITGFYEVQPNGMITIPILGNIAADGVPLAQISKNIIEYYSDLFKRPSSASVTISERRPVFIVGPVAHPGTYTFTRGMTPLHLIALAGGLAKPSVSCAGSDQATRGLLDVSNAFHALRAEAGTTTEISLPGNAPLCPGDLLVVP